MNRNKMMMFAFAAMFLTACGSMTAAETTGVIAAGTGVLTALADAIVPYLPADKQALVVQRMTQAQGVLEAVTMAFGSVAQSAANAAQSAAEAKSSGISTDTALAGGGAIAAGSVALSRVLSIMKHGRAGKMTQAS